MPPRCYTNSCHKSKARFTHDGVYRINVTDPSLILINLRINLLRQEIRPQK